MHSADAPPRPSASRSVWRTGPGLALAAITLILAIVTVGGMIALWPDNAGVRGTAPPTFAGKVSGKQTAKCGAGTAQRCVKITVLLDEGRDRGARVALALGPQELAPGVQTGDAVRVADVSGGTNVPLALRYNFGSVDRRAPLLWLGIAFAIAAVVFVAWRGALSVIGLLLSLGLVTAFLLPAITEGSPALPTALTAAMAVTFVTVLLTSGVGIRTVTAILAIALTLALAAGLAMLMADLANLDGRTSEVAAALTQATSDVSLKGVVIAGVILGVLGALTDTAVTQASAVMALRRANPSLGMRRLYLEASAVGRDHLSATIHTLVLAYTGATLPLLLALHASGVRAIDAFSSQDLAEPIVAALVGALALLICVPVSTGLSAWTACHLPAGSLPDGHDHQH